MYYGYPDQLPVTDGRWEVYDSALLERIRLAAVDRGAWRWVVDRYGLEGILLAHTSPEAAALLQTLRSAGDGRMVCFDRAASFWMPDEGGGGP
jgi:hypothetical protein